MANSLRQIMHNQLRPLGHREWIGEGRFPSFGSSQSRRRGVGRRSLDRGLLEGLFELPSHISPHLTQIHSKLIRVQRGGQLRCLRRAWGPTGITSFPIPSAGIRPIRNGADAVPRLDFRVAYVRLDRYRGNWRSIVWNDRGDFLVRANVRKNLVMRFGRFAARFG